jgi:hypothetical protein
VLPPARLTELLRRWVIEADPAAAAERRSKAEQDRAVRYRREEDGLYSLFARGIRPPDLQAVAQRIRAASQPVSSADDRTADQRRCDAFVELLLGRDPLSEHRNHDKTCACLPGSPAPCGAKIVVLVPLRTASAPATRRLSWPGTHRSSRTCCATCCARGRCCGRCGWTSTTGPGRVGRPARATSGRAAVGTTGPNSSAGRRPRRAQRGHVDQPQRPGLVQPEPAHRARPRGATDAAGDTADPFDWLELRDRDDELEHLGLAPVDDHVPEDVEPEDVDWLGDALREGRTGWGLDLDDPYRWLQPTTSDEHGGVVARRWRRVRMAT